MDNVYATDNMLSLKTNKVMDTVHSSNLHKKKAVLQMWLQQNLYTFESKGLIIKPNNLSLNQRPYISFYMTNDPSKQRQTKVQPDLSHKKPLLSKYWIHIYVRQEHIISGLIQAYCYLYASICGYFFSRSFPIQSSSHDWVHVVTWFYSDQQFTMQAT